MIGTGDSCVKWNKSERQDQTLDIFIRKYGKMSEEKCLLVTQGQGSGPLNGKEAK